MAARADISLTEFEFTRTPFRVFGSKDFNGQHYDACFDRCQSAREAALRTGKDVRVVRVKPNRGPVRYYVVSGEGMDEAGWPLRQATGQQEEAGGG